MATIILLRHAHSSANSEGILAGRKVGISLSERGREESQDVARRLSGIEFRHIHVSPLERCSQTLEPLLKSKEGSRIQTLTLEDRVIEMDYGKWSGEKLSKLAKKQLWKEIQTSPSKVTFPDGESFKAMKKRSMNLVNELLKEKGDAVHLIVSHGDVIKVIVASLLGMKLDGFQSLVIDPASITVFQGNAKQVRMVAFNDSHTPVHSLIGSGVKKRAVLGGGSGKK